MSFITAFGQAPLPRYSGIYTVVVQEKSANKKISLHAVPSTVAAPKIGYTTPQIYLINAPIATLIPSQQGGAVPAANYGELTNYAGSFGTATGVAADATGIVYVADWSANAIIKVAPDGSTSLFAGNGSEGIANGQGTAASFNEPDALITDAAGNIYVADQANNMIRKITPGGLVSTLAGNGQIGATDGTGQAATFNNPRGLTFDTEGNLYVADQGNNLIRKVTPAGVVTTYAGTGAGGSANGPRLSATFNTPTAVEADALGNLYISDSSNGLIRKIDKTGNVTTFASGLVFPRELRIDGTGNLYVADQNDYCIKRISPAGVITIIAGHGVGNGQTYISGPIGLMLDGKGNLYVGDGNLAKKIVISGYTIDKALPPGLVFDPTTGTISGTPTSLWPPTDYLITAYNGGGSGSTSVNIQVRATLPLKPSIITLPLQQPIFDASSNYDPLGTSTNNETPIIYTSSNPLVAVPGPNGLIHVLGPGVTTIIANQAGNANYEPATQVTQQLTVVELLYVALAPITAKTTCDADFTVNTQASNKIIPLTYASSNPSVATISPAGGIHIVGTGTTTITLFQNADPPLYKSATPATQTFTVSLPVLPAVEISAVYDSPCAGSMITFAATATNAGAHPAYQWQVNSVNKGSNSNKFSSADFVNGDMVTCTITNTDDNCISGYPVKSGAKQIILVTPQSPSVAIAASVNEVFAGTAITFTATTKNSIGDINYQWFNNDQPVGNNSNTFTASNFINGDVVTCIVSPVAGCSTPASSNPITVVIVAEVTIPNTFTPNGDGSNDVWTISGIASYPKCNLNIYNRYGTLLYQSKGYAAAWDGTMNGKQLPAATYYYVIDLGAKSQRLSGPVTILR